MKAKKKTKKVVGKVMNEIKPDAAGITKESLLRNRYSLLLILVLKRYLQQYLMIEMKIV